MAEYIKKEWEESDDLKKRQQALEAYKAAKPGEYSSANGQLSADALKNWQNYKPFNYDINADTLYNQYKNSLMTQGRLAMKDTMGQAAALTGGYGSSYAQSVGQQAYQGYLQKLNDVVPALQDAAYNRYLQGKNDAYNNWQALQAMESQDYGRYIDELERYNAEYDRLSNEYNNAYDREYSLWQYGDQAAYRQYLDALSQENWQKQFDADQAYRNWQTSMASASASAARANSVTAAYDNGNVDREDIKAIQRQLGIPETGYWDEVSYRAAGGLTADDAYHLAFSDPDGAWTGDQAYVKNYLAQTSGENTNTEYLYARGMYKPAAKSYDTLSDGQRSELIKIASEGDPAAAEQLATYYLNALNLSPEEEYWLTNFKTEQRG